MHISKSRRRRLTTAANRIAINNLQRLHAESLIPSSSLVSREITETLFAETRRNAMKRYLADLCACENIRHANFCDCGLTQEDIVQMRSVLADHPSIESIDVSDNPLDPTAARVICAVIRENPLVTEVRAEGTGLPEQYLDEIRACTEANLDRRCLSVEKKHSRTRSRIQRAMAVKFCEEESAFVMSESDDRDAIRQEEKRCRLVMAAQSKRCVRALVRAADYANISAHQEAERQQAEAEESMWRNRFLEGEMIEVRGILEAAAVIIHSRTAQGARAEFERIRRAERGEWVMSCRRERRRSETYVFDRAAVEKAEHRGRLEIIIAEQRDLPDIRDAARRSFAAAEAAEVRGQRMRKEDAIRKAREKEEQYKKQLTSQREKVEDDATAAKSGIIDAFNAVSGQLEAALAAMHAFGRSVANLISGQNHWNELVETPPLITMNGSKQYPELVPLCFRLSWQPVNVCPSNASLQVKMRDDWDSEAFNAVVAVEELANVCERHRRECATAFGGAIDRLTGIAETPSDPHDCADPALDITQFVAEISNSSVHILTEFSEHMPQPPKVDCMDIEELRQKKERVLSAHALVSVENQQSNSSSDQDHLLSDAGSLNISLRHFAELLCTVSDDNQLKHALVRRRTAFVLEPNGEPDVDATALEDSVHPIPQNLVRASSFVEEQFFDAPVSGITSYLRCIGYYSSAPLSEVPLLKHINVQITVELDGMPPRYHTVHGTYHVVVSNPYIRVSRGAIIVKYAEGTAAEASPLLPVLFLCEPPAVSETPSSKGCDSNSLPCCVCNELAVSSQTASSFDGFQISVGFGEGHDPDDRIVFAPSKRCWLSRTAAAEVPEIHVFVKLAEQQELCLGYISENRLLECKDATLQLEREERQPPIKLWIANKMCTKHHIQAFLSSLRYFCNGIPVRMGPRLVEVDVTDTAGRCSTSHSWIDVAAVKSVQVLASAITSRRASTGLIAPQYDALLCTRPSTHSDKLNGVFYPFSGIKFLTGEEVTLRASIEFYAKWFDAQGNELDSGNSESPPRHTFTIEDDDLGSQASIDPCVPSPIVKVELPNADTVGGVIPPIISTYVKYQIEQAAACRLDCFARITFSLRDGSAMECEAKASLNISASSRQSLTPPPPAPSLCFMGSSQRVLTAADLRPECLNHYANLKAHGARVWITILSAEEGDALSIVDTSPPIQCHCRFEKQADDIFGASSYTLFWDGARIGEARNANDGGSILFDVRSLERLPMLSVVSTLLQFVSCEPKSDGKRLLRTTVCIDNAQDSEPSLLLTFFHHIRFVFADLDSMSTVGATEIFQFFSTTSQLRPRCRASEAPVSIIPFGRVRVSSAEYFDGGRLVVELSSGAAASPHSLGVLPKSILAMHANRLNLTAEKVIAAFNMELDDVNNTLVCDINGESTVIGKLRKRSSNVWIIDFPIFSPPIVTPSVVELLISCFGVVSLADSWATTETQFGSCALHLTEPTSSRGAAIVLDLMFTPPLLRLESQSGEEQSDALCGTNRLVWRIRSPCRPLSLSLSAFGGQLSLRSGAFRVTSEGSVLTDTNETLPGLHIFSTRGEATINIGSNSCKSQILAFEHVLRALTVSRSLPTEEQRQQQTGDSVQKQIRSNRAVAARLTIASDEGSCDVEFF